MCLTQITRSACLRHLRLSYIIMFHRNPRSKPIIGEFTLSLMSFEAIKSQDNDLFTLPSFESFAVAVIVAAVWQCAMEVV